MWIPRRPLDSGTIRGRLLGSLVVLVLLPIVVLVASWFLLGRTRDDARRIDLAGSLRTGGFVIAAQLNSDLVSPAGWKRAIVGDELARMHRTLDALEHGSEELGVGAVRAPELRERLADARHALELYEEVTARVYAEFDRGALGAAGREEASQEVLGSAYGLFAITNRTAESLEAHTTVALGQLRLFQAAAQSRLCWSHSERSGSCSASCWGRSRRCSPPSRSCGMESTG